MPIDALRNQVLGYFSIPSGIAVIDAPFRERSPLNHHASLVELQGELTRRHEYAHYRQIMTTPFGFLIWRCFNSLISDIEYIAAAASRLEPLPAWEPPLHTWVASGGLQCALQAGARDDPSAPFGSRVPFEDAWPYLQDICQKVEVLQQFLAALIGKPAELTVGRFLHLCELAFAEICERCDLQCGVTFASRRNAAEPLYGTGMLSGAELMEAATRLEERQLLEDLPSGRALIPAWEAQSIFGVYEPGYRMLLNETGDAKVALAIVDMAFMTPFDPAFLQESDATLYIEDLLPTLRLPRLVMQAKRHFWSDDARELDELMGTLVCQAVGLEAPKAIAARGASAIYNGPRSWGTDYANRGGPDHLNPRLAYVYFGNECRRAMQMRHDSPCALYREHHATGIAFRPAIIFHQDTVVLGTDAPQGDANEFFLVAALFRKFLHDTALLKLVGLTDGHDTESLRQALWKRVVTRPERPDWFFNLVHELRAEGITDDKFEATFFGRMLPIVQAAATR